MVYRTSELGTLFNLAPSTIKYYEQQGLLYPKRANNNYRCFCQSDIGCLVSHLIVRGIRSRRMPPVLNLPTTFGTETILAQIESLTNQRDLLDRRIIYLNAYLDRMRQPSYSQINQDCLRFFPLQMSGSEHFSIPQSYQQDYYKLYAHYQVLWYGFVNTPQPRWGLFVLNDDPIISQLTTATLYYTLVLPGQSYLVHTELTSDIEQATIKVLKESISQLEKKHLALSKDKLTYSFVLYQANTDTVCLETYLPICDCFDNNYRASTGKKL